MRNIMENDFGDISMLTLPEDDLKAPLLFSGAKPDTSETYPLEAKKTNGALPLLSDFHFSIKTLPSRRECFKKYSVMLLSIGGGLGYWSAVEKYNQNHNLGEFESNSNIVCVVIVTSFFLLQSVDLARNYLKKLADSAPPELSEIIEISSEEKRRSIKQKTAGGSLISGLPFLIIGINDSLPFIANATSEIFRKTGISIWAIYFYSVNVGLHILPFALVQTPEFNYYLWPVKKIYHGCQRLIQKMRSKDEKLVNKNTKELEQAEKNLLGLYNEIRGLIATRLSGSLTLFFEKTAKNISMGFFYDLTELNKITSIFSEEKKGINRLLFLLREYPPQQRPAIFSTNVKKSLRITGAQLELGGAFIWWTNIFPTLYNIFNKAGLKLPLVYFLTIALGITPSYVLFVLLAFFGENQFPRFVHYIINAVKKLSGKPNTDSLLPPIAQAHPFLFAIGTLIIGYLSYFAPVNAKSLNEEQYQDIFSPLVMMVLDVYADIGISLMSFISLLDLFKKYLTEISAVFTSSSSPAQLQSRLLITQENLLNDLMRTSPKFLIEELKSYKNDEETLHLLLGSDKNYSWVNGIEAQIKAAEINLEQKKSEQKAFNSPGQIQGAGAATPPPLPNSRPGLLSSCRDALFSVASGFTRCFRRSNSSHQSALGHP